jgi:A/G-specific adenine glycosylase
MAKDKAFQHFRQHLLPWAAQNPRPLPWKNERDPYKIWLSEIILQQTRVAQGLPYYLLQPTLRCGIWPTPVTNT